MSKIRAFFVFLMGANLMIDVTMLLMGQDKYWWWLVFDTFITIVLFTLKSTRNENERN